MIVNLINIYIHNTLWAGNMTISQSLPEYLEGNRCSIYVCGLKEQNFREGKWSSVKPNGSAWRRYSPLVILSRTVLSPFTSLLPKFLTEVTFYILPFFRQVVAIVINWPRARNNLKRHHLVWVLPASKISPQQSPRQIKTQKPLPSKEIEPNNQHPLQETSAPQGTRYLQVTHPKEKGDGNRPQGLKQKVHCSLNGILNPIFNSLDKADMCPNIK